MTINKNIFLRMDFFCVFPHKKILKKNLPLLAV